MGEQKQESEHHGYDEALSASIDNAIDVFWEDVDPHDPYSVLGLKQGVDFSLVKTKYRHLMK